MKKILLLAAIVINFAAVAQKVNSKLAFKEGQKIEMIQEVKNIVNQEFMGQSMEINMNSSLVSVYDVENVKNGQAVIEHKVKQMKFNVDAMGQNQSFDSEKEDDMKSETGKNMEKALKNKYSMTVDAKGNVVALKLDDDNPNRDTTNNSEADAMTAMIDQLGLNFGLPKVGEGSIFKILPDKEVSKGESWSDSKDKAEGAKSNITYTVADITANDIIVNFLGDIDVNTTQEMMGMEATTKMKIKSTGIITLDKKTGIIKSRTSTSDGKGNVDISGQSIPVSTKVTETVTFKIS